MPDRKDGDDDGYHVIFRRTITTRDGKVIHASNYGLKAFPIRVKDGK